MADKPAFEMDLSLQIGKYDIQKQLGKGATGTVYLAVDTFSGDAVALKTIEPEVFRDPEFGSVYRTQFQNEASLAGKLRHPHIVAILDAVVQEDSGYIAMEIVTGGDLSQHATADSLLPIADVLQIAFKCCGALDYASQEGIVHRDIKPANIMVAEGSAIKIADFGAAYLRRSQAVASVAMGSPYYMSPEQIEGKDVTYHTDMYSLGVVMFELLTGKRPFTAGSMEMLMEKILLQDAPAPSSARKDIPKAVDAIVMKAMSKLPRLRYDSWGDFAADIAKAARLIMKPADILDSDKHVALKSCEMLSELTDAQVWELVRAGRWSRSPKATVVMKEGDEGDSFFFLAQGGVKVTREGHLLNLVGQSECFGEMAYIRGGDIARHATVETMGDVLLAEFRPLTVMQMSVGAQLHLMRALVRNVVDRLELANTRLAPR
jgi:serine/threonine protein kinase